MFLQAKLLLQNATLGHSLNALRFAIRQRAVAQIPVTSRSNRPRSTRAPALNTLALCRTLIDCDRHSYRGINHVEGRSERQDVRRDALLFLRDRIHYRVVRLDGS